MKSEYAFSINKWMGYLRREFGELNSSIRVEYPKAVFISPALLLRSDD